ncbi:hypothetical protein OG693_04500 [Streptomyces sp. NBC_01259]|uniref:hypothetical protein n=1 Tax=Streptomyces sp. NBC_01259 TaxID=2903800 RepID=UPI003251934A
MTRTPTNSSPAVGTPRRTASCSARFLAVIRVHETYHRAPAGLSEGDESRIATEAVARLRGAGYQVDCDEDFDTTAYQSSYLPVGASVSRIAERIREATTTEEAAEALVELTAAHDGILAALDEVLAATADFHDGLGQAADPYIARRLRYLADEHLGVIRTDLSDTRNTLADRHELHPGRSTCTEKVPANERERSAVCACPPPPRTLLAPPPPVAAGLRR